MNKTTMRSITPMYADDCCIYTDGCTACVPQVYATSTHHPPNTQPLAIVRVFGGSDGLFNRASERTIFRAMSQLQLGPTLLVEFANGRVEEFWRGHSVDAEDMRQPWVAVSIARAMAGFHWHASVKSVNGMADGQHAGQHIRGSMVNVSDTREEETVNVGDIREEEMINTNAHFSRICDDERQDDDKQDDETHDGGVLWERLWQWMAHVRRLWEGHGDGWTWRLDNVEILVCGLHVYS